MERQYMGYLTMVAPITLTERRVREILELPTDYFLEDKDWDEAVEQILQSYVEDNDLTIDYYEFEETNYTPIFH